MARANLRQLSRQFARGIIDRATYRRQRAELIEALQHEAESDSQPTGAGPDSPESGDGHGDTEVPDPQDKQR
jgi:hypothetical protein